MATAAGARLPAEWESQAGVLLTWPHAATDWADRLDAVVPVFARLGAAISRHETLLSACTSKAHAAQVRAELLAHGAVATRLHFAIVDSNDSWARDHGPLTTLRDGRPILHDFRFNGWGGKFAAGLDDAIPGSLHRQGAFAGHELQSHPLVLEGGAIETDGLGTLLATRSSMISETRNPGLTQSDIEALLGQLCGLARFLWLDHGDISGDDTDGHVDTLARFVDAQTIVYATAPPGDPDHPALQAMAEQLAGFRSHSGAPYRLLPLPFPGVHCAADGRRLPATYANFLLINDCVLLPAYGVAADQEATALLQTIYPQREVVTIDARPIIEQHGSLHCLTMQFPAEVQLSPAAEVHPRS